MSTKVFLTILLFFWTLNATSINNKNFGSVQIDEVTSVYDGDTFRATIKAWPQLIGERIGIRINGIDTPEMRGKCQAEKELALRAKQHTVAMLRNAKVIELRNMKRGKYFRILADVFVDGKNVGESLVKSGMAVEYHGGKKTEDWCAP